jgi:hypothetical protein
MAVVKYGSIIDEIKGKLNGQIFQGGRNAPILRSGMNGNGKKMTNSPVRRQNQGNRFSTVAKYWSQITPTQRITWSSLLGVWTFTDKFGDVYNGTPYQIFCACNLQRLILQQTLLTDAPTFNAADDITIVDIVCRAASTFDIRVLAGATSGQSMLIAASTMHNDSFPIDKANFVSLKSFIYTGAMTENFRTQWNNVFGVTPVVGKVIFVKTYQCFLDWPQKQFIKTFKITIT